MKFVRVVKLNTGEEMLLALQVIKVIYREDSDERASIVEDYDGNLYECYSDTIVNAKVKTCTVEL